MIDLQERVDAVLERLYAADAAQRAAGLPSSQRTRNVERETGRLLALLVRATNADTTLPTEAGLVPGAGSIVAALEAASGQRPIVIGKPETPMLETAMTQMGVRPEETVMLGDRLDTDILAGERAGMPTVLVLTGVSTREDLASAEALPDVVVSDLPSLVEAITAEPTRR